MKTLGSVTSESPAGSCRFNVDDNIVYSDRKGIFRSVGWLENQTTAQSVVWKDHLIGGKDLEAMFLDIGNVDNKLTVACNTRNGYVRLLTPGADLPEPWESPRIIHSDGIGGGKGTAFGDVNNDGHMDLDCKCKHAEGKVGVYWLSGAPTQTTNDTEPQHRAFNDFSGNTAGSKFDRIKLPDLARDGDHDLLTCEERDNLGVICYENSVN
ncbi:MAG: hypothetical protein P8K08_26015 [Fuerstiella sp.]|jgi:hypothetical protein|nr:hypothetical protein [Fuerstiella sp.]